MLTRARLPDQILVLVGGLPFGGYLVPKTDINRRRMGTKRSPTPRWGSVVVCSLGPLMLMIRVHFGRTKTAIAIESNGPIESTGPADDHDDEPFVSRSSVCLFAHCLLCVVIVEEKKTPKVKLKLELDSLGSSSRVEFSFLASITPEKNETD